MLNLFEAINYDNSNGTLNIDKGFIEIEECEDYCGIKIISNKAATSIWIGESNNPSLFKSEHNDMPLKNLSENSLFHYLQNWCQEDIEIYTILKNGWMPKC